MDKNIIPNRRKDNSMLEDQIVRFGERDHYLRKNTINIDSAYRQIEDHIISVPISAKDVSVLMSSKHPGRMYIYQNNHKLDSGDVLYFQGFSKKNRVQYINTIPVKLLEYDEYEQSPIFNIHTIKNEDVLRIFSWYQIEKVLGNTFQNEAEFKSNSNQNFYYFDFSLEKIHSISDFIMKDSYHSIKIFKITKQIKGYPETSYFKMVLQRPVENIYKIRLIDIKIPEVIYNVNNKSYSNGSFKYKINNMIRFILKDDRTLASNIDYVSNRVRNDFWTKKGVYDIRNFVHGYYKQPNQDIYKMSIASKQESIMFNLLTDDKITENKFLELVYKRLFEFVGYLHYGQLLKLNQYNVAKYEVMAFFGNFVTPHFPKTQTPVYTVVTHDIFKRKDKSILIKNQEIIDYKYPFIFSNDMPLYVNKEIYGIELYTISWIDSLILTNGIINAIQFVELQTDNYNNENLKIGKLLSIDKPSFPNTIENLIGITFLKQTISTSFYTVSKELFSLDFKKNIIKKNAIIRFEKYDSTKEFLVFTVSRETIDNSNYSFNINGNFEKLKKHEFVCGDTVHRKITESTLNLGIKNIVKDEIRYVISIKFKDITDLEIGSKIHSKNSTENKIVKFLGKIDENYYYRVCYNAHSLLNFREKMFLKDDILYQDDIEIGEVEQSYEQVGEVAEVILNIAIENRKYLSDTQTTPITLNEPTSYHNKIIHLSNDESLNVDGIIVEARYDKTSKLYIFEILITVPFFVTDLILDKDYNCFIDEKLIGRCYTPYYDPFLYNITIEKDKDFYIEHLYKPENYIYFSAQDPVTRLHVNSYFSNKPSRNYISVLPYRVNEHNLQTYDIYPIYETKLQEGLYDNLSFVKEIETKLNQTQYQKYNYFKKEFEKRDINKEKIDNPNLTEPVFKVKYSDIVKNININCYKKIIQKHYTLAHEPINSYIYIKLANSPIQNNQRVYIDVIENISGTHDANHVAEKLNREFTARILPVYSYQLRVIYPVYPKNSFPGKSKLEEMLLDISKFYNDYNKNKFESFKYSGQALINEFNNAYQYNEKDEKINFRPGVNCPFIDDELVVVINSIHFQHNSYKLGRLVTIIDKTANSQGNFNLHIQLTGMTNVSLPFYIGDIIYGFKSKTIAMVVPNEWGMFMEYPEVTHLHNMLPTNDLIRLGYKNYIKFLYKHTKKRTLLETLNSYNLQSFNEHCISDENFVDKTNSSIDYVRNPFHYWPIDEVINAHKGFEIPIRYDSEFSITNKDLMLEFLIYNEYSLFLGKTSSSELDTPQEILDIDVKHIHSLPDYDKNDREIDWEHSFTNFRQENENVFSKMYITYGSDNMLQNKMYLFFTNNIRQYKKDDQVFLKSPPLKASIERTILNVYPTKNLTVHFMTSFEHFLNFFIYRLALVELYIPIPMGPNDFMKLAGRRSIRELVAIVENLYHKKEDASDLKAFVNLVLENYGNKLKGNKILLDNYDLLKGLMIENNQLEVANESVVLKNLIKKVLIERILPWFIEPQNILLWTRGDRRLYTEILTKYIEIENENVYRVELLVEDNFVFAKNISLYDSNSNKIGHIINTSIVEMPKEDNILEHYIIYVKGIDFDTFIENSHVYTIDGKHKNKVYMKPILMTKETKKLYVYDCYIKHKTIMKTASDDEDVLQRALNFNEPESYTNVFMNFYNPNGRNTNSFRSGEYVQIDKIELFLNDKDNSDTIFDEHRVILNMFDIKNIVALSRELGLMDPFSDIQSSIKGLQQWWSPDNFDEKKSARLIEIFQMFSEIEQTILIDLDWTKKIENDTFYNYHYQVRKVGNIHYINGSKNFMLEPISLSNNILYGYSDTSSLGANNSNSASLAKNNIDIYVTSISSHFQQIFQSIYSHSFVTEKMQNNQISDLTDFSVIQKDMDNKKFPKNIFDIYTNPHNFLYGFVWLPVLSTKKVVYIIIPSNPGNKIVDTFNKINLNNYQILFNFVYVDGIKEINLNEIEFNETIQNNVIKSITPLENSIDDDGNYRIFKINLKFAVKYDVISGTPILIKDYVSTLYKPIGTSIKTNISLIVHKNWENDLNFKLLPEMKIQINANAYNSIFREYAKGIDYENLSDYTDDFLHEETNIVKYIGEEVEIKGKKYLSIELANPLKYNYAPDVPIIFSSMPQHYTSVDSKSSLKNNNDILCHCLSTQNLIIDDEWYTQIYYQGEDNMDLFGVNKSGIKGINENTQKKIRISGMKGIIYPSFGFQDLERNNYNMGVTYDDEQGVKYIKPVPDGLYHVVNFQKEEGLHFFEHTMYELPIPGYNKPIYNGRSPEQSGEWIDNHVNYRWFTGTFKKGNINLSETLIGQDMKSFVEEEVHQYKLDSEGSEYVNVTKLDRLCKLVSIKKTDKKKDDRDIYQFQVEIDTSSLMSKFMYNFNGGNGYPEDMSLYVVNSQNQEYIIEFIESSFYDVQEEEFCNSLSKNNYHSITIKGRYQGFGGILSFENENNILNSISYTVSDVNTEYNAVELNIQNNDDIYTTYYRNGDIGFNKTIFEMNQLNYNVVNVSPGRINPFFSAFTQIPYQYNPSDINSKQDVPVINYYDIYPTKFGSLANYGTLYKKKIHKPMSTATLDYIYLCFKNIDSKIILGQNTEIDSHIIFAKIFVGDKQHKTFASTDYEIIYDTKLLPKLEEVEVFYLDKFGNLVNFNNLDTNLMLEIYEYVENINSINTRSGMVIGH